MSTLEKLKGLVREGTFPQISLRASFYSGRGPEYRDIRHEHLAQLFKIIKDHFSEKASESFVKMVASIPSMAASVFIDSLVNLATNNWKWEKEMTGALVPADKDNLCGTMIGIHHAMNPETSSDETARLLYAVRVHFLKNHLSKEEFNKWEEKNRSSTKTSHYMYD